MSCEGGIEKQAYQTRNHSVQLSTRSAHARTTQYISHGVSWAGSEVLRALYEAKRGKRKDAIELAMNVSHNYFVAILRTARGED